MYIIGGIHMHIGLFTDGLAAYSLEDTLATCEKLGIKGVELGCGGFNFLAANVS